MLSCSSPGSKCPLGPCPLRELLETESAAPGTAFTKYEQRPAAAIADHPQERHLRHPRQLTFGGTNAEGYFSFESDRIIFQSTRAELRCDQIFSMGLDAGKLRLVSTGLGKTTCGYYFPGQKRIVYASTHL